jgi:hypothetical protein
MHPQNTQDSAGFAQIALYSPFQIGNAATPPVLYRLRGKQLHPDEQLNGGNESLFSKQIPSGFHDSGVIPILTVICERDFFQERNSKTSIQPQRVNLIHRCPIRGQNATLLRI